MNWEDYDDIIDAIEGRQFYSGRPEFTPQFTGRPVASPMRRKFDVGSRHPDGRLRRNLTRARVDLATT